MLGGTSAGNVYAGGSRRPSGQLRDEVLDGVVLRYDGEAWKPVAGGEAQVVGGIWPVSPDEIYFTGPALNG